VSHAWVIGGSEGIGLEVARLLQSDGWEVTISARNQARLDQLASDDGYTGLAMDATDATQVQQAVKTMFTHAERAPTRVLINIGDYEPMSINDMDATLFARLAAINYLAPVALLEQLLPRMRDNGGGDIWINASLAAYRGLPNSAPYSASKAAVLNMAECLAPESAAWGIHLGVINHGFVRTRLTAKNDFAMPAIVEPQEAARHIVNGMRKKPFEISFPWLFSRWMKFMRCLPYPLYFFLTRRLVSS
jgi:NAD(P)-dependent dehydrogenase (short-subunit alcohol dehydrogenase family)